MPGYRSPVLARAHAVEADPPDAGVALHYGDPMREQRQLDAGVGGVDLSHRAVIRVSGSDRLSWLHSLTSQHLEHLDPGASTEALVLSPHGHVEHQLHVVDDGAGAWAIVEGAKATELIAFLDAMRFLLRVEIEDLTDAWAVVSEPVRSPHESLVSWVDPWPGADGSYAAREVLVPRSDLVAYLDSWEAPAGIWAHEALRIAARRPRLGFETDHRTIPHEVGWLATAVHLDKGCYRGQETVARVHNLGRPPRRLVFLHLDGSVEALPGHGEPVTLDGRQVGFVTSAARHYELGPIALALVKRTTPEDAPLLVSGAAAAQDHAA
jgi:tRNA-modifying protein YgfZ